MVCALATWVFTLAGPDWWQDLSPALLAMVFVVLCQQMARRSGGDPARYGIDMAGLLAPPPSADPPDSLARTLGRAAPSGLRELGTALGVAALVFPVFALGFRFWHGLDGPFELRWPPAIADFLLSQLILVALPEEMLFRGYFQTRLGDLVGPGRCLGAPVHPIVLLAQAAAFAALHLVASPSPARLAVFFPGLLFGWLRARRGGIGAAIFLHAFSNLFSEVLSRAWL